MSSVGRGGQIKLTASFYEYIGGPLFDPIEDGIRPSLNLYFGSTLMTGPLNYSGGSGSIQRESIGTFSYLFYVPIDAGIGTWRAHWDGIIHNSDVVGDELFEVIAAGSVDTGTGERPLLGEDFILTFSPGVEPLYIDPDELSVLFPDASELEIMELIYIYSVEVDNIRGTDPITDTMLEYIKASVACSLSKIYDFGAGASGPGSENSITLGDLAIVNRGGTGANSKGGINRGNYANWCEYAYALREEMLRTKAGMRAVLVGSAWCDPMPSRAIRRKCY